MAEVVKAIDAGAEDFTDLKVFKLTNADPQETADLLTSFFPTKRETAAAHRARLAGFAVHHSSVAVLAAWAAAAGAAAVRPAIRINASRNAIA